MLEFIKNIVDTVATVFTSIWSFISDVINMFNSLFSYLPTDLSSLLMISFTFVLVIGLIIFIRKILQKGIDI